MSSIPNTPSAAYLIPGLINRQAVKIAGIDITPEIINRYKDAVEQLFDLAPGLLQRQGGGRQKGDRSRKFSDIRKAVTWDLLRRTTMTLQAIADAVGVEDHTSVIYFRKKAYDAISIKDQAFQSIYERVKDIPLT